MAKRNKYSQDYEVFEVRKDTKGSHKKEKYQKKLVYKGSYFAFEDDQYNQRKRKWYYAALMLLIGIVFTGIGMLNNEGSRKGYVIFPYIFMVLPIFYGIMGGVKLLSVDAKMTRVEYDQSVIRIRKSSVALLVLAITCVLGEIVYLISNHISDYKSVEYLFLTGTILIAGISFLMVQLQNRCKVSEIKDAYVVVKNEVV